MRRFQLQRNEDLSGISGTGIVAEGVLLSSGRVAMEWFSEWPSSVVFYDDGIKSLIEVHGHNGSTEIIWIDDEKDNR